MRLTRRYRDPRMLSFDTCSGRMVRPIQRAGNPDLRRPGGATLATALGIETSVLL